MFLPLNEILTPTYLSLASKYIVPTGNSRSSKIESTVSPTKPVAPTTATSKNLSIIHLFTGCITHTINNTLSLLALLISTALSQLNPALVNSHLKNQIKKTGGMTLLIKQPDKSGYYALVYS